MNRHTAVVDASVTTKWILPEDGQLKALRLRESYRNGNLRLMSPPLLLSEVGNALWKLVRRGSLERWQAEKAFERILSDTPIIVDSPLLAASALQLAMAHDQTVYDCLYLALALAYQCDLITADEKFFLAVHKAFPTVRLLRDYVD
jgi:predicted nucleic acid-binding protein